MVGGISCSCGVLCRNRCGLSQHIKKSSCKADNNIDDVSDEQKQQKTSESPSIPIINSQNSNPQQQQLLLQLLQLQQQQYHHNHISPDNYHLLNNIWCPKTIPDNLKNNFTATIERLSRLYIDDPTEMNLFYILCLPKMCLGQQHNQKQNLKQKQIQIQNKSRS